MPGSTSIYGLPYLEPNDPPDIAGATEALAEAVEAELVRVDGATVGVEAAAETPNQPISAATIVTLRWQAASSNVGGFGKPNPTDFTVPTAGVYVAAVQGLTANSQSGRAFAQVVMAGREFRTPFGGAGESGWAASGLRRLAAGAIVKAEIYCATATSVNGASLVVYKVGP